MLRDSIVADESGSIKGRQQELIDIGRMGCGTWSWGNRLLWDYSPMQDEEIFEAYKIVRNAGITLFDTADSYGTLDLNGRAEILLGKFERRYQNELQSTRTGNPFSNAWAAMTTPASSKSPTRPNVQQVATKFAPYPWRLTRGSIVQAARESLQRLNQTSLCIAQLHWSTNNYLPIQERALWEGIADVYDEGLCEAIGVSNYGPRQLSKIIKYLEQRYGPRQPIPLATVQIQYSLLTYQTARYMNDVCDANQIRLISYSPLCLGLLSVKYDLDHLPRPGNPRRELFRELLSPSGGAQRLIDTLRVLAGEYGKTPSQIAIQWTMAKNTVPIPGCKTVQQALENVDCCSGKWELSPDAVAELDAAALAVKKPMIQNLFQTK
jgi:pyridoxine 4-dehydrogenase